MLNFLCTIIKEIKSFDDMMEVGWRGEKRKKMLEIVSMGNWNETGLWEYRRLLSRTDGPRGAGAPLVCRPISMVTAHLLQSQCPGTVRKSPPSFTSLQG